MLQNWKFQFALLWSGQAISLLTSSILQMALVWYLTNQTGSAIVLSMATLVGFLPQAILGTFVGVFIDRRDRKLILILADLSIALLGIVLAAYSWLGELPIWIILVVLCLRSVGAAFHAPALQAITPSIVPKDSLTQYAGYSQSFESISMIASPALAAVLFSVWSLNAIILLDVAGALIAVFLLTFIQVPKPTQATAKLEKVHIIRETLNSLKILRQTRGMITLIAVDAAYALVYFPIGSLYPLITMRYFGGSVMDSGTVEVIFSVGTLLGSLLLGYWGNRINKAKAISRSIGIYGIGLILTGLLPTTALRTFMFLSIIMGISVPFYHGLQTAILQIKIKDEYLGRVFSLSSSISMIAMPLGLILAGGFAETIGLEKLFFAAGVFTVLLAALVLFMPSFRHCCDSSE